MDRRVKIRILRLAVQFASFFLFNLGFFVVPLLYWMEGWVLPINIGFASPFSNVSGFFNLLERMICLSIIPFLAIGITILIGTLVGRAFCSWLCPMGLFNDLFGYVPINKAKISHSAEETAHLVPLAIVALLLGYTLLAGFSFILEPFLGITFQPFPGFEYGFFSVFDPYNTVFSTIPWLVIQGKFPSVATGIWTFIINNPLLILQLIAVIIAFGVNVIVTRFYCRFLCPTGTCMGFFGRFKLIGLRRDPTHCTKCKKCEEVCPMNVPIMKQPHTHIEHRSCDLCLECYGACPEGAIKFKSIF